MINNDQHGPSGNPILSSQRDDCICGMVRELRAAGLIGLLEKIQVMAQDNFLPTPHSPLESTPSENNFSYRRIRVLQLCI